MFNITLHGNFMRHLIGSIFYKMLFTKFFI